VDSVQEFSNELDPISDTRGSGPSIMTALLAGETSIDPTTWAISFYANDNIRCQEWPYTSTAQNWYNNLALSATVIRDPSPGSPLRLSTTCTFILEDPTATTQIYQVISMATLTTSFDSHGYSGSYQTQTISPSNITIKSIPSAAQVDIQHNQVASFNVVISFQ
jgi:hypothetical protein